MHARGATELYTSLAQVPLSTLLWRDNGVALRPGALQETAEQHQELYDFCKRFKFERMGAFAYSSEEGTPAASLPEQVRRCSIYSGVLTARHSDVEGKYYVCNRKGRKKGKQPQKDNQQKA